VKQLNLDTKIREALAQRILTSLEKAATGSTSELRGSLAEGNADAYSDIDVLWEVPDERFQVSVGLIEEILSEVQTIESVRSAPDFHNSDKRRLFFVQFADMPLFWRADIDVFAESVQRNSEYDLHNEAARGTDWSLTHSALMNDIAAVKTLLRHHEDTARQLLIRGFERIGLDIPKGSSQELVQKLAEGVASMDSSKAALAYRIVALNQQVFGQDETA